MSLPYIPGQPFTADDWAEVVAFSDPGGPDAFSWTNSDSTIVIDIPFAKQQAARAFILGYAYADDGSPYNLYRINPPAHPIWSELRAVACTFQRYQPRGNDANPDNAPYDTNTDNPGQSIVKYTNYQRAKVTVKFGPLDYPVLDDGDPALKDVWDRNVDFYNDISGEVQLISAQTNATTVTFAEGSNTLMPPPPPPVPPLPAGVPNPIQPFPYVEGAKGPKYTPFTGEIGEYLAKATIGLTWAGVPSEYILNPNTGIPDKIFAALGKVNKYPWAGYPAGTLLFNAVSFQRIRWPYSDFAGNPRYGFNIVLKMSYVDPIRAVQLTTAALSGIVPPLASSDPTSVGLPPYARGQQLFPNASSIFFTVPPSTSPATPSSFKPYQSIWFYASRSPVGDGTAPPYFAIWDYDSIFSHVLSNVTVSDLSGA